MEFMALQRLSKSVTLLTLPQTMVPGRVRRFQLAIFSDKTIVPASGLDLMLTMHTSTSCPTSCSATCVNMQLNTAVAVNLPHHQLAAGTENSDLSCCKHHPIINSTPAPTARTWQGCRTTQAMTAW